MMTADKLIQEWNQRVSRAVSHRVGQGQGWLQFLRRADVSVIPFDSQIMTGPSAMKQVRYMVDYTVDCGGL